MNKLAYLFTLLNREQAANYKKDWFNVPTHETCQHTTHSDNKKGTGTLISGVKTKYEEEKVAQQAYYFVHHKSDKK